MSHRKGQNFCIFALSFFRCHNLTPLDVGSIYLSTKLSLIRAYLISKALVKTQNAQVSCGLVQTVNRHDLQCSLVTRHPGDFRTLITSYSLKTLELDLLTSRYYNIYQDQKFVSFRHSQPEN